jgi:hypothetical protein
MSSIQLSASLLLLLVFHLFRPEDGRSTFLLNADENLPD